MATLGYRDSGSVVLSKAEALRQAHEKEGERSRLMTWSKRKSPPRRKKDEREEREKEEAAEFEMKLENIIQKRPDKRLKWLQKGMIMVGRKTIKANAFFDLIMDKVFISDVPAEIGTKMKASVLANLHLFSSKQQKALQSESCHFNTFASATSTKDRSKREARDGEAPRKKKARRGKDSRESAVHAIVPPRHLREMWSALYFAHGGSGYVVSRGLLPKIRASAPACLEDMLEMTSGDAMEDVIFALCLQRQLDIQVKSYGFLKPMTHRHFWDPAAEPELATQEIVVNFHQARDELLDRRRGPGEPLQRFMHWDAQPPPLHGCIMVAHPVENETDLHEVHSLISRAALAQHHALALLEGDVPRDLEAAEQLREGSRAGHGRCVLTPMTLARQAEVRLSASGSDAKAFWTSDQLATFSRCFEQAIGPVARCDWQSISEQHYGLSFWPMARSVNDCAKACCRSGADCSLFQFNEEEGCWLGLLEYSQAIPSEKLWHDGVKL